MHARLIPAFAAVLLLGACATPGPRERDSASLQQFLDAAGPPVDSFHFVRMQRWESLGPEALAVWTRINQAWLIRVDAPCFGLDFSQAIALSSSASRVSRRFDTVNFDNQRCTIAEIRPVDVAELKAARAAAG